MDVGNGNLIKMTRQKAEEYVEANRASSARIVATPARGEADPYSDLRDSVAVEDEEDEVDLESMTRAQLESYAAESGIDVSGARTKSEVLDIIQSAEDVEEEDDEDDEEDEG